MIDRLVAFLFRCRHAHRRTFPQTPKSGILYVTCLDCGTELPYSWEKMCVEEVIKNEREH